MRRALLTVAVAAWAATAQAGIVNDFGDLRFWVGSGTNQAALVLDFGTAAPQGAPPAVAWGYRWNGAATLDDMVFGLAGSIAITGTTSPAPAADSDPRLGIAAIWFPDYQSYLVTALTYDQVGLPIGWSQESRSLVNDFDNDLGIAEYVAPAAGGTWPAGGTLDLSTFGLADTALADGGWYGYVVAQYDPTNDYSLPATYAFSQPAAAIPEPATGALAAAGIAIVGLCLCLRRRSAGTTLG